MNKPNVSEHLNSLAFNFQIDSSILFPLRTIYRQGIMETGKILTGD
jgi:hypothetical protein